jgi:hypothetical protein
MWLLAAPGQPIINHIPKCVRVKPCSSSHLTSIHITLLQSFHSIPFNLTSPLPLRAPNKQPTNNTRSNSKPTHNSHPKQPLLLHLILNQILQTLRLQIPLLQLQQTVVIPPSLCIISQLVVSESEVVEALAPAVGALSEDVGEQLDAELLLVALVGFDQAPGVVELGLQGGVGVFFFVLGAQDGELGGFEGGLCVGGVWEKDGC